MKAAGALEQIYHSGWHHPGVAWGAGAVVLALLGYTWFGGRVREPSRGRGRELALLLVAFQLAIGLDAWFSGTLAPLDPKTGAAQAVAIAFVVLGDLRFFLLIARYGLERSWPASLGLSLALGIVVPSLSSLVRLLSPNPRVMFLIYELSFAAFAAAWWWAIARMPASHRRRWLARLAIFEVVQYLGWASADVVILAGADAGYGLRLVPNIMYYAGFVPFAWLALSEEAPCAATA